MSLVKYNSKRKFDSTPEPSGSTADGSGYIFVVQRHHASHLHYDFRLELNGTLKSWAIPKGPSMNPKDKRLAMMVEDHPVSYASFKGEIPEGNYGAGRVDIWDHGTYEPLDDHGKTVTTTTFGNDLKAGSIKFRLHGRHLKGEFALVRMNRDKKAWLLIKHHDEYATDDDYNSEDYASKEALAYTAMRLKNK